jgi:hypothetical protein
VGSLVVLSACGGGSTAPALPLDYRSWTHTKTALRLDPTKNNSGLHHIYANPQALQALKAGGPYPEGSRLVFNLYEAKLGGDQATGTYIAARDDEPESGLLRSLPCFYQAEGFRLLRIRRVR